LVREIRLHREQNTLEQVRLDTVYFGGGTPTALKPDQLCEILELVKQSFGLHDNAEITVEAHPDTMCEKGLRTLRDAGFNRLSLGIQSMDQEELIRIGRSSTPRAAGVVVDLAHTTGFDNVNLDLIYGLPGQTSESWRSTLDEVLALNLPHLSCYALTVEEGTRLMLDLRRGDATAPDEMLQNEMENETVRRLTAAGFRRYEISNFAKVGFECRHNLLYWTGQDYLGLGPSAQSYVNGSRFGNVENLALYHQALAAERLPVAQIEHLSDAQQKREAMVFGLRLIDGIDQAVMRSNSQVLPEAREWEQRLDRLIQAGLLEDRAGRIRLTESGRRFADSVGVELF
jgi:oxygen-independent coproporphyrinogen-3 oxidase